MTVTPRANKYKLSEKSMLQASIALGRTSQQIQAEIAAKFGFVPPFFGPAAQFPQVLENLWQQTLTAYVNNPLPALFKEKLSAYLSRYCAVPYCMICHSCTLRPLGLKAREVLELLELSLPTATDIEQHLKFLAGQPDSLTVWSPHSTLEDSLLYCAIFIALAPESTEPARRELQRVLGFANYQHLITFIAYVKTCHVWMEAHPEVAYEADRRVQEHLGALLEEEPDLASFFRNYKERVSRERHSRAERQLQEEAWRQQAERERLVALIAQRIRQSLNLEEILKTTVSEVRQFLQTDRVFIYRFSADWSGFVAVESVAPGWHPILGTKIKDSFFGEAAGREHYKQGRIQATNDVYTAGLSKCHLDFLARLQIRSNLVVPIVQGHELWGLLVANQCASPRQWQQLEIELLKQLATQVGIAIQQSTLFEQVQAELGERKRSEEKIREQAALLDVATDAINVQALDNQVLLWNKGAESLYGWETSEALGKNAEHFLYKDLSQCQAVQQSVVECGSWQGELRCMTKAGKEIIVSSRWTLVRDELENPKSILVVNTDITEKKRIEAQFLRAQRLESIGTLASGIAHDLNNVLGPILMIAELLQDKIADSRSQQLLAELEASAKRGASLVSQVLSFGRGIEGKRTILQAKHLLWEIQQIAKQTFPKSIEIHTNISPTLWTIRADATQIHQVLMNLIVNARDAMPNGGTLRVCAENLLVDETYAQMNLDASEGSYSVITISDTGMGMKPDVLERIFEPFFTTKELGKGTGLGLSTVMSIIKSHGGFVNVCSEVGRGTEFKVYLPAVKGVQIQRTEESKPPKGNRELILVVDDELVIREVTQTLLETHNYRVLTASDGIEAIALYAQHKAEINVVIMDMMMPNMDGLTTTRILQKMNSLRVIAVSGLASKDKVTEATSIGIQSFLFKPYTAQELLKTISAELSYLPK